MQDIQAIKRKLRHQVGLAIDDFQMIEAGDRVMVALSGGKDSYTLLDILLELQQRAPIEFELVAVNLDQGQPGFPKDVLPRYLKSLGVPFHILTEDTYSIVKEKVQPGKTLCSLCSRLRRGILYSFAREIKATKIALGHHREDIIETFFLNMFHGAKLKAMPAKLLSDDGTNVIIRPLAYCPETMIAEYSQLASHPIIPCRLCGSQENMQRRVIKKMLQEWETQNPGRLDQIRRSLGSVVPSHLLMP